MWCHEPKSCERSKESKILLCYLFDENHTGSTSRRRTAFVSDNLFPSFCCEMEKPKVSVVIELGLGWTGVLASEYPELTAALRWNDRLKINQTHSTFSTVRNSSYSTGYKVHLNMSTDKHTKPHLNKHLVTVKPRLTSILWRLCEDLRFKCDTKVGITVLTLTFYTWCELLGGGAPGDCIRVHVFFFNP